MEAKRRLSTRWGRLTVLLDFPAKLYEWVARIAGCGAIRGASLRQAQDRQLGAVMP
jgi:hypothetical protein